MSRRGNISTTDKILSHLYHSNVLHKIIALRLIIEYVRVYRNYSKVLVNKLRNRYPIEAELRNGNILLFRNKLEAQLKGGVLDGFQYDTDNDIVTLPGLSSMDRRERVKLYGGTRNGDIMSIYLENVYEKLPVNKNIVIDIGANIADSSIYFALRGAERVIGLEPFPKNYELAKKNISFNSFSGIITILLAGCGAKNNEITIDPSYESGIGSIKKDFKNGIKVPFFTIEQVLIRYQLMSNNSIVLKMDCEGCEYETILSANEDTLRKFSYIAIEYHYGYKNLKEKIEKCGFNVSVTRPHVHVWNSLKLQSGHLFAEKY